MDDKNFGATVNAEYRGKQQEVSIMGFVFRIRKNMEIVSYPLIEELNSTLKLLNEEGKIVYYPKSREFYMSRREVLKVSCNNFHERLKNLRLTMEDVVKEVTVLASRPITDKVLRVRYYPDDYFGKQKFSIMRRHEKGWECDTQYNREAFDKTKNRRVTRGQRFYPQTQMSATDSIFINAYWVFDYKTAQDNLELIKDFAKNRQNYLMTRISDTEGLLDNLSNMK